YMKKSFFPSDDDSWDDDWAQEEDLLDLVDSPEACREAAAAADVDVDADPPVHLLEAEVLATLMTGKIHERGLLPYSSNTSFLVVVDDGKRMLPAVYKPQRGENPLWDFEWGTLCQRETAAYVISSALGWQLVPPTVLREGTRGLGSIQFYIDHDANHHYFTV